MRCALRLMGLALTSCCGSDLDQCARSGLWRLHRESVFAELEDAAFPCFATRFVAADKQFDVLASAKCAFGALWRKGEVLAAPGDGLRAKGLLFSAKSHFMTPKASLFLLCSNNFGCIPPIAREAALFHARSRSHRAAFKVATRDSHKMHYGNFFYLVSERLS